MLEWLRKLFRKNRIPEKDNPDDSHTDEDDNSIHVIGCEIISIEVDDDSQQ